MPFIAYLVSYVSRKIYTYFETLMPFIAYLVSYVSRKIYTYFEENAY